MLNPFFKGWAKIRRFNHHCNEGVYLMSSCIFVLQPDKMSFDSSSVLVVGTVAFDSIRTPFGHRERIVGGAGTYIGWSASRLGVSAGLVSVVGDDFPEPELEAMRAAGMKMGGVECKTGEKSFFWSGSYHMDMNGRDTLETELNVLADFQPVIPESWKQAKWVMLGNIDPGLQASVLDQLDGNPELVVLDTMNFWMDIAMDGLKAVIERVDVLTINDEEARQLSGERSLVKAARVILDMGPQYLIIKKGEHGALLFHLGKEGLEYFFCPALPLEEVVDPTGAGDTFAGGFIGHLASLGRTDFEAMKEAVVMGSALASFTCESFGTEGIRKVDSTALDSRLLQFRSMTDWRAQALQQPVAGAAELKG
jgi:sugar/nucleoside kinase (ribokinase family)